MNECGLVSRADPFLDARLKKKAVWAARLSADSYKYSYINYMLNFMAISIEEEKFAPQHRHWVGQCNSQFNGRSTKGSIIGHANL